MIVGEENNSIVTALEKSEFTFYLTGSRFFGNAHEKSDWDFFTEDSGDALRDYLRRIGFRRLDSKTTEYTDMNVIDIWENQNVHVQVIRNLHFKRKAQVLLNTKPFKAIYLAATKTRRRHLWEGIFKALYDMNEL